MTKHNIEVEIPDGKYCYDFDRHIFCWYMRFSNELNCYQCCLIRGVRESILKYKKGYSEDNVVETKKNPITGRVVLIMGNTIVKKNKKCPSL